MDAAFAGLYAGTGRPSTPPEQVFKALLHLTLAGAI